VTVICMGPFQVEEALREVLGMGVDRAIQLTAKQFAGSDTWTTSYTLGLAMKKIGQYDLIIWLLIRICGIIEARRVSPCHDKTRV